MTTASDHDDHGLEHYLARIARDRRLVRQPLAAPRTPAALTCIPMSLNRRSALLVIGGTLSVTLGACGGSSDDSANGSSGSSGSSSSSSSGSSSSLSSGSSCTATPEGEIGPYFADDSDSGFNRSNILANLDGTETQTGVPLTLNVTIIDTENSCAALEGAQVDIWHCNASGVYSDIASENTSTQTWLRGYQLSDANGLVSFTTIIPGWYSGRTTHIHLRVRSNYSEASSTSDGTNTTQVFFPQSLIDTLANSVSPYSSEGTNPTTNVADRVYTDQTHGEMLLTLTGTTSGGYTADITIGVPITNDAS